MPKMHSVEKKVSSIHGAWKIGYEHVEKWNCILISYYAETRVQMDQEMQYRVR